MTKAHVVSLFLAAIFLGVALGCSSVSTDGEICTYVCAGPEDCVDITCPSEYAKCVLECSGPGACSNYNISCSGNCEIECSDSAACQNTTVTCPDSSGDEDHPFDCMLGCRASDSCTGSILDCQADVCVLQCDSSSTCTTFDVTCGGRNCTLECHAAGACSGVNMTCADSNTCQCEGDKCTEIETIDCGNGVLVPAGNDCPSERNTDSASAIEYGLVIPLIAVTAGIILPRFFE